jgi:hypothetical protein
MILLTLALLLVGQSEHVGSRCGAFPELDAIAINPPTKFLIIGEVHGTNEVPALFLDLVCQTSAQRRVTVAIEQPSSNQPFIDAYLNSNGGNAAERAFMRAPMWNEPLKDGKSSQAYFALFAGLKDLALAGRPIRVVTVQPEYRPKLGQAAFENMMAKRISNIPLGRDGVVLALLGNVHAMLTTVPFSPRYRAAASFLPPRSTFSFNVIPNGGGAWNCEGSPAVCKTRIDPPVIFSSSQRVIIGGAAKSTFTGIVYLGKATTSSPPK